MRKLALFNFMDTTTLAHLAHQCADGVSSTLRMEGRLMLEVSATVVGLLLFGVN